MWLAAHRIRTHVKDFLITTAIFFCAGIVEILTTSDNMPLAQVFALSLLFAYLLGPLHCGLIVKTDRVSVMLDVHAELTKCALKSVRYTYTRLTALETYIVVTRFVLSFFCGGRWRAPQKNATDTTQPWGLLCKPVMKMKRNIISFFCFSK
jgi:hypothetical protein